MRALRARRGQQGAILVAVALVVTCAAMGAVLMTMNAASANKRAETERHATRARYLARGGLDVVQQLIADRFFRTNATQAETSYLIESFEQVAGLFEEANVVKLGAHDITYGIRELDAPRAGKTEEGLNAFFIPIEIESVASVPGAQATARRMVVLTFVPVYQFAAFYDMDLEIWPGPAMVLNGPVHTNGDLYVGADRSITFDTNYIHAAGSFYQSRAYAPIPNSQPVMIRRWVEDPTSPGAPIEYEQLPTRDQMSAQGIASTNGLDSLFPGFDGDGDGLFLSAGDEKPFASKALELFTASGSGGRSTLATGEHGVKTVALPQMSSKAPFVETEPGTGGWDYDPITGDHSPSAHGNYVRGPYHEQAGLKILLAQDGTWSAVDGNGLDVTSRLAGAVRLSSVADVREKGNVKVAVIDIAALQASGQFPANGLLYLAALGDTPLDGSRGFLLEGGAELPAPFTTITDNFLYVQGDYNIVDKKPAAVVADVVNLLSNAWDGSKSLASGKPAARETTYNMAIVSGFRASVEGQYSGGFENMPRFHETWSGVRCNITGSFVALWEPAYSREPRDASAYDPPERHWSYDTAFDDFDNLPPFTPFLLQFAAAAEY